MTAITHALSSTRMKRPSQDLVALEGLYRRHHAMVRRLVERFGVEDAWVDDVTHDVFLEISRAEPELRPPARERAWVAGVTRNLVLRHRRNLFRHIRRVHAVAAEHPTVSHGEQGQSDAARDLHVLLDQLSEEQRTVFVLSELEEWTAPEIAAALGIKLPTVYSRLHAAREALTRALSRVRARERGTA
ncbi:MAG: sigma-70 family RNA polymerase sigma factor [Polyangiales bacterium]